MGEDAERGLRTLNTYKEVMGSFIQQNRGWIVGTAGDSVLAEFGSVLDAAQCAVEIQAGQFLKGVEAKWKRVRKQPGKEGSSPERR